MNRRIPFSFLVDDGIISHKYLFAIAFKSLILKNSNKGKTPVSHFLYRGVPLSDAEQNLIPVVAVQSNAPSVWQYLFSSNRIEVILVLPENEPHQQKITDSLADPVVFAQKHEL
jgi:hypothetical protein